MSRWAVLLLDMAISVLASLFAVFFVRWIMDPFGSLKHFVAIWVLFATGFSLVGFAICHTFRIVIRHSTMRSVGNLALATLIKEALLTLCIFLRVFKHFQLSSLTIECLVVMMDALLTLVSLVIVRVIIITIYENLKADNVEENVGKIGVLIYGTGTKSVALLTRLENSPHYNVLGFLTSKPSKAGTIISDSKAYYCDNIEELAALKTRLGVDGIIFASDGNVEDRKDLVDSCFQLGIHILSSPKIDEVKFGAMSREAVREINNKSVDFIPDGMSSFERNVKRIVDCVVAFVLLLVFSPLALIVFIAIKRGDGGPAIFKQERIGRFGRPFNIYKFRSMKLDAESAGPALYAGDDDPRLTKVGKFIRQHHLDELPQLWNVFIGDMAFIGYRPERQFYIDQIMEADPRYYYLYQIRPGVTSYATLNNGYTDTLEKMLKRLEYDLYYLRHRSWWFDIKILFFTFCNIVFGKKF